MNVQGASGAAVKEGTLLSLCAKSFRCTSILPVVLLDVSHGTAYGGDLCFCKPLSYTTSAVSMLEVLAQG